MSQISKFTFFFFFFLKNQNTKILSFVELIKFINKIAKSACDVIRWEGGT